MNETDRLVDALQRRVAALEEEAARLRQPAVDHPPAPLSSSRRQVLLGGAGMVGAMAGGALLGYAAPVADAATAGDPASATGVKHLSLHTILTPLKTRDVLWADHEWAFGAHFTGKQPPVVVATALDDYMEHDVASYCVCAVKVHGAPGAYRATIMVRNISALATAVAINAIAIGS